MHCVDCIQKNPDETPEKADVFLINEYESVRPLCQNCYDEYAYMEGDFNLDSYYIDITGTGQYEFIKAINSKLKYLNMMNQKYSDRYFAAKKMGEDCQKRDVKIAPHALLEALDWYK